MTARHVPALLDEQQLTDAWASYKLDGNPAAREKLILHFHPLVVTVARRIGVSLPAHIDHDDLVSYGVFGLMDAIAKFDLDRNIRFQTYASTRIHGAIIDELRSIDWVPRSVRSQVRSINTATQKLEGDLQREPTQAEIADTLNLSGGELHRRRGQQNFIHLVALDAEVDPQSESDYSLMNQLRDNRTPSPTLAYENEEVKDAIAHAVSLLSADDRLVLVLYYVEGLTLHQMGEILGFTESRACQKYSKSLAKIREHLAVV